MAQNEDKSKKPNGQDHTESKVVEMKPIKAQFRGISQQQFRWGHPNRKRFGQRMGPSHHHRM